MTFRRFSSTDLADVAALLNRLGDDLDDTITKVLGARQAAQADATGVLARYADTAQKAWDGLAALTQRVANVEATAGAAARDTGWITATPATSVNVGAAVQYRVKGGICYWRGVVYGTGAGSTLAAGSTTVFANVPAAAKPPADQIRATATNQNMTAFLQVGAGGKFEIWTSASTNGWFHLSPMSYPID